MQAEIIIDVPGALWLSSNDRPHWAERSRRTRGLRMLGRSAAIKAGVPRFEVAAVTAFIGYPRGGRADPANAHPTMKALVDGFTDAGCWEDDDSQHVLGPIPLRGPASGKPGVHTVRFLLIEQGAIPF